MVIRNYLLDQQDRYSPFKDSLPGKDCWNLFMRSYSNELSLRKPQYLSTHCAVAALEDVLDKWFEKVTNVIEKIGLYEFPVDELKKRLWNCDETGFYLSATSKYCI
uniref:DDE-1 domain-containing protein n=1 Tax=Amphimedon queenslandica TaxID=400682 RepID=A0A1X7V6A6_AMPQE